MADDMLEFHVDDIFPLPIKKQRGKPRPPLRYSAIIYCAAQENEPIEGETIILKYDDATYTRSVEVIVTKIYQLQNLVSENRNFVVHVEKRGKNVTRSGNL